MILEIIETPHLIFCDATHNIENAFFTAKAICDNKNYSVFWDIKSEFKSEFKACACDFCDDDFACDWLNPKKITNELGEQIALCELKF